MPRASLLCGWLERESLLAWPVVAVAIGNKALLLCHWCLLRPYNTRARCDQENRGNKATKSTLLSLLNKRPFVGSEGLSMACYLAEGWPTAFGSVVMVRLSVLSCTVVMVQGRKLFIQHGRKSRGRGCTFFSNVTLIAEEVPDLPAIGRSLTTAPTSTICGFLPSIYKHIVTVGYSLCLGAWGLRAVANHQDYLCPMRGLYSLNAQCFFFFFFSVET